SSDRGRDRRSRKKLFQGERPNGQSQRRALMRRVRLAVETRYMPKAQPKRCSWVNVDQKLMREYHDREWGVPTHDDRTHFEFLILEAAQAGLSWSIVLNKREGYRRAFSQFDPEKVARYSQARIDKLSADSAKRRIERDGHAPAPQSPALRKVMRAIADQSALTSPAAIAARN